MSYFTTTKTIYDSVHEYPNKKKRGYGIIEDNPKVYDWTRTTWFSNYLYPWKIYLVTSPEIIMDLFRSPFMSETALKMDKEPMNAFWWPRSSFCFIRSPICSSGLIDSVVFWIDMSSLVVLKSFPLRNRRIPLTTEDPLDCSCSDGFQPRTHRDSFRIPMSSLSSWVLEYPLNVSIWFLGFWTQLSFGWTLCSLWVNSLRSFTFGWFHHPHEPFCYPSLFSNHSLQEYL